MTDQAPAVLDSDQSYTRADYYAEAGSFFRTLSALLFTELTQEEIDNLAALDSAELKEGLEPGDLLDGFTGVFRYLARRTPNVRQDLAVEYARIFLGAGVDESDAAIPFESVFTSPDGLLMQDARDQVVRVFASQGVHVDASLNVPEDHLSFELQFLATMCERCAAALENGEDVSALEQVQVKFIDEHILNWIDALAARVDASSLSPFYPSVIKLVKGYCVEHRAAILED